MTARRVLLDGLARDADIFELAGELAPLHPRDNTFPGEVLLRLAADALDWCEASRADPLSLEGLRERFLPECTFRGRQITKLQYAVLPRQPSMAGRSVHPLSVVRWLTYARSADERTTVPVDTAECGWVVRLAHLLRLNPPDGRSSHIEWQPEGHRSL